jgi:N-acetylmuramoyl-L-alanine amidase CwlA
MSYTLKTNLANKSNYGAKRSTSSIKYIPIHYTGNDGDTDEANAKYFKNNIVKASAHYFVDDDSVTQSVPDDYIAYAVGGSKYSNCATTGGGTLYGKCTNANSISVELCDTVKDGKVYPSDKTIENAVALVKTLMAKYNIPVENVIRHFDVNGKSCPAYWCGDATKNALWFTAFRNKLVSATTTATTSTTATSVTYYSKYTGTTTSIVTALKAVGETDTSLTHRKKIATANSISGYTGTAAQNTKMLTLLKSGKLIKA